jgi:hypothetical protein
MMGDKTLDIADIGRQSPISTLQDAEGIIPTFPARRLDARGRLVPLSAEEREVRSRATIRALTAIEALPDDPPGMTEAMMRGIDANRPAGSKVFEGMY